MLQHPTNGNPPTLFLVLRGWIFTAVFFLVSHIMFNEKRNGYATIALWLLFWCPPSMVYCNISFKAELLKSPILHKMTLIPLHIHLRGKNRNVIQTAKFLDFRPSNFLWFSLLWTKCYWIDHLEQDKSTFCDFFTLLIATISYWGCFLNMFDVETLFLIFQLGYHLRWIEFHNRRPSLNYRFTCWVGKFVMLLL